VDFVFGAIPFGLVSNVEVDGANRRPEATLLPVGVALAKDASVGGGPDTGLWNAREELSSPGKGFGGREGCDGNVEAEEVAVSLLASNWRNLASIIAILFEVLYVYEYSLDT
jgi:hypothetical protein